MADPTQLLLSVDARLAALHEQAEQFRIEQAREQERLRGLKPMRWVASNIVAATSIIIGTSGADAVPIQSGYVWDLRIIAGKLSANDSVAVYIGENALTGRLIGYAGPPGASPAQFVFVILIPKSSAIFNSGETLFLTTSGTASISAVNINAWEAPGPMVGKLF